MNSQIVTIQQSSDSSHSLHLIKQEIIRRGSRCPQCGEGIMDFNGLLDLECECCGYSLVEGAGCS